MGCMKIAGHVVGATDGPNVDFPACFRSRATRRRMGCDDAMPETGIGEERKDEERAVNVRSFCEQRGMTSEDIDELMQLIGLKDVGPLGAYDHGFPHARRLGRQDGYARSSMPAMPRIAPRTAEERAAELAMFPNANRLKV